MIESGCKFIKPIFFKDNLWAISQTLMQVGLVTKHTVSHDYINLNFRHLIGSYFTQNLVHSCYISIYHLKWFYGQILEKNKI